MGMRERNDGKETKRGREKQWEIKKLNILESQPLE